MSKHTSGPWALNGKYTICTNDAWHHEIAVMKTVNFNHAGSNVTEDQAAANARLIAAAPELLEALEALLDFDAPKKAIHAQLFGRVSNMKIVFEAIEKARAAIAKAKGE